MRILREVLDAIAAHARRESPRECCGLLVGTALEIFESVPASNVAEDPSRRYEVSPADHLAQIRRCREVVRQGVVGVDVVGAYHSHPRGTPEPSPTDRAEAFPEYVYLIAGPVDGPQAMEIRGYRLAAGAFEPVALIVA